MHKMEAFFHSPLVQLPSTAKRLSSHLYPVFNVELRIAVGLARI
jgi:hypothetical protein